MWKCGYRYLSCEKLHKICQLVPTLQIREQLVNICFFSAVSCSFLNASIHFLWTLNYAMTEYRVILLTANFSIWGTWKPFISCLPDPQRCMVCLKTFKGHRDVLSVPSSDYIYSSMECTGNVHVYFSRAL